MLRFAGPTYFQPTTTSNLSPLFQQHGSERCFKHSFSLSRNLKARKIKRAGAAHSVARFSCSRSRTPGKRRTLLFRAQRAFVIP